MMCHGLSYFHGALWLLTDYVQRGNSSPDSPVELISRSRLLQMSAPKYCDDLQAEVTCHVGATPRARVHQVEWRKIMDGLPVEINPSIGQVSSSPLNTMPAMTPAVQLTVLRPNWQCSAILSHGCSCSWVH
jgi:hypothetical protein